MNVPLESCTLFLDADDFFTSHPILAIEPAYPILIANMVAANCFVSTCHNEIINAQSTKFAKFPGAVFFFLGSEILDP